MASSLRSAHGPDRAPRRRRRAVGARGAVRPRRAGRPDGPVRLRRRRTPGPIGVVLAGGAGRRLGGGKAVVDLDGRPLLAYPRGALRAGAGAAAVVARSATGLPQLDSAVRIWLEPDEPRHPMTGVVRALKEARGRAVLCVAVDLPLVPPGVLRRIATTPVAPGAA